MFVGERVHWKEELGGRCAGPDATGANLFARASRLSQGGQECFAPSPESSENVHINLQVFHLRFLYFIHIFK